MKFSVGDLVLLKQSNEQGVVRQWLSNDMLEVEINGVIIPVFADEVDHPYLTWFTQKNKKQSKPSLVLPPKEKKIETRQETGLFLQLYPKFVQSWDEELIEKFQVFLLNETAMPMQLTYDWQDEEQNFSQPIEVHAFQNVLLHDVPFKAFVAASSIHIQWQGLENNWQPFQLKLRSKKAAQLIHEMRLKAKPFIQLEVLMRPEEEKNRASHKPQLKIISDDLSNIKSSLQLVVKNDTIDLHAEALGIFTKGKDNALIISMQIQACRKFLDTALFHHLPKVTIVHGHGKGVLKSAVVALLQEYDTIETYDHDWDGRFGFGATHVYFRKW